MPDVLGVFVPFLFLFLVALRLVTGSLFVLFVVLSALVLLIASFVCWLGCLLFVCDVLLLV